MSADQFTGLAIAVVVMFIGLAGCVIPGIPSSPLVLAAAIGHRLYFGPKSASNLVLAILVLVTVFSMVLDSLASLYGAKKMGATWRGIAGAVIGGVVGLFFSLPGLILGPFVGALLFELAGGRGLKQSGKAGLGATLGLLAGAMGKLACCVAMIGLFTVNVWMRSRGPLSPEAEAVALREGARVPAGPATPFSRSSISARFAAPEHRSSASA